LKVIVASIGAIWAYNTYWQQREQSEKLVNLQVAAQYSSERSQRESADAEIVAGLIPFMKCEAPKEQRGFAIELLRKMDSRYADEILLSAAHCEEPTTGVVTHSVQQVTQNELKRSMLDHLRVGRRLQSLELFRDAAREYSEAYQIGSRVKVGIDEEKARKGIAAVQSKNYYEAAEWFRLVRVEK